MGSAGAEGPDTSVFIDLGDDVSDDMAQLWQEIASASAEAPPPSITSSPPTNHLGQVPPCGPSPPLQMLPVPHGPQPVHHAAVLA